MSGSQQAGGPDLAAGVASAEVPEGGMTVGHVGDEAVLLARVGGELFAIGAHCTHYGAPLGEGLIVGHEVRCPWHHARFCLRTGEAVGAPAIDPVGCWRAGESGGRIVVSGAPEPAAPRPARKGRGPRRVLIAGGGAGGFAAAEMLRRQGFDGEVRIVSADAAAPYDRPNCSKDYLAGEAQPEWMPLRQDAWYADNDVDLRLGAEIGALDLTARTARAGGEELAWDALILALGAEPARPPIPGLDGPGVFTLRSLADADAIIAAAAGARRATVVGASFIGLETAAALRHRGLEVHVAAPESIPLERVLGPELGRWIRGLHEEHGVVFHLGRKVLGWSGGRLQLDEGPPIEADFVIVGTGVRPRTALAQAAGLAVDNGVVVDDRLRCGGRPDVLAVGDIARYPDPVSGRQIRVEHWVHAERQGQHAARVLMGEDRPFTDPPFFWSAHYDSTIRYVGHAESFDAPQLDGSLRAESAIVRYAKDGRLLAVATLGRDVESLEAGAGLEAAYAG
jgi:NADPH-dependent 2,4-dienoyl-CoA reductase/sulfur reductase-like enzyme/nitrite reductase/ring-hydroxylating ferredoxin subunit